MARSLLPLALLTLAACGGDVGTPTFAELEADVFGPSCSFSSCHLGGAGGLTLGEGDDYAALVNAPAFGADGETLVIPGDAANSYLVKKLEGAAGIAGEPMPPPSGGLDAADIEGIRNWIDAGAPEQ